MTNDWRQLFNGNDLDGWRMVGPGEFTVENGCMVTHGGMGLLWYEREPLGNCEIKIVFRLNGPDDNSGIFIRIEGPSADPWHAVHHGYEVQIYEKGDPAHRTGCLYSLTEVLDPKPLALHTWVECFIRLEGPRTRVWLDGRLTTDYTEGQPVPERTKDYEPIRGPRTDSGYIGLQNHDANTRVEFREVSTRALS